MKMQPMPQKKVTCPTTPPMLSTQERETKDQLFREALISLSLRDGNAQLVFLPSIHPGGYSVINVYYKDHLLVISDAVLIN